MKRKLLIAILIFSICDFYGQDKKEEGKVYDGWTFIFKSKKTNHELYYQLLKENTVWFKTVYNKPKKHEEITLLNTKEHTIISDVVLYVFDCESKEIGIKSNGYWTKDAVVDYNQNSSVKMKIPFPDTMESFYLEYYCENIKNK
ncbi:hypothetical protein [Tenacibaculum sp. SG-28]|uniref:hypothetical protein n=1 Tax=Tenacibaculum sp. SG-28 TaxID=754426 RepID=UPI000CF4B214|nr:hypothetical protein [Tenacibaculum sp. SG-28]PQJ23363.1 hypothetical protein BSU00_03995 [Tenacibaculum sp. SG-28]